MGKAIDTKAFWGLRGMRAIRATVVTAQGADGPAGLLALSVTHVTATPPTLLVSIGWKTSALSAVSGSPGFAVNYLAKEREDLAKLFGSQGLEKGADRFGAGEWTTLSTGAPIRHHS